MGSLILSSVISSKVRKAKLLEKYDDPAIVDLILRGGVWVGQSADQLRDSLGRPVDVDQKVLKTKIKETWKYNQTGKNRFALRVTLEQGRVVGWDDKR